MQQGCLIGAADRRREAVDGRPLHDRRDVRVDVHRGVAEPFLNDLHVLPRFEQNRCVSVAQAVQGEHLGVAGVARRGDGAGGGRGQWWSAACARLAREIRPRRTGTPIRFDVNSARPLDSSRW